MEDDVYDDYFIPKGTLLIPNVWEMNHDPAVFGADAHGFNPSRYLDESGLLTSGSPSVKDDGHFSFGMLLRIRIIVHGLSSCRIWSAVSIMWTPRSSERRRSPDHHDCSVCVGKHVANNSLFIEIATCLWAFSLTNPEGQRIDVNAFHDEGVIVYAASLSTWCATDVPAVGPNLFGSTSSRAFLRLSLCCRKNASCAIVNIFRIVLSLKDLSRT